MTWLSGRPHYDRTRVLQAAHRARSKKKRRRAIELYRWVLAVEPQNGELHARLAPLLAETGQPYDAWHHFRATVRALIRDGQQEKVLSVYRDATSCLPGEMDPWQALARRQHELSFTGDAIETLLEGSRQVRGRDRRTRAIALLKRARGIDSWHFEVCLELARVLPRARQAHEARIVLEGLARRTRGRQLRRVRGAQFRLDAGIVNAWRWLRAAFDRTETADPEKGTILLTR